jgi:putative PIN family toxin of toxin-antitoxin system
MRVVADTNVVVSGLLWHGPSRQVLDAARVGQVQIVTTMVLLTELEDVLNRPKFAPRLAAAGVTTTQLVIGYGALATVIVPASIAPVILADPDDDAVLACAKAAKAVVIVSGDHHLQALGSFQGRTVVSPVSLAQR